ncbi:MAG: nucleotidyltransferase family protein [Bacteroidales bacterium]|nr:nucleotidyltransferase family protein [Bacteroidales bacterium]
MLTRDDILIKLRELKPFLNKEYAVKEIGLFGSFSDNSEHQDSDIDLMVVFERPIGWKHLSLELYLQGVFGRKIDLVTKNAIRPAMKERILKQISYI